MQLYKIYTFLLFPLAAPKLTFGFVPINTDRGDSALRKTSGHLLQLRAAADADDDEANNIITLAVTEMNESLSEALSVHPTMHMLGIKLNLMDLPHETLVSPDDVEQTDAACFASPRAVKAWLDSVDAKLGIVDMDEEEKKKMGNGGVVAVCLSTETARKALESGRWESRYIYYPKGDGDDVGLWADSAVQAMGDILERRFWGGGW